MASQVMLTMTYRTCIVDEQPRSHVHACINLSLGDHCALTDYKKYVIHALLLLALYTKECLLLASKIAAALRLPQHEGKQAQMQVAE